MLPWLPAAVLLGLVTISGFYHAADKVAASPRSYHRHRLVRVTCAPPSSDLVNQAAKTSFPGKDSFNALFEAIDALANAFPGDFDVWGMKSQDCTALVRLAPRRFDLVDSLALRFSIEILHEDVAQLIAAERDPVVFEASGTPATPQLPPFLTDYHKLEDIFKFMDEMVAKHSDLVKPVEIGQSFEGRPIRGLRIRRDTSKGPKFGFVMHGGQHAREWISVAMMNYMIHRLVSNGTLSELLDSFEMIVVPVLNPDGYVWSWEKDRMWRKNRQPNKSILPIPGCVGTDLNRNWGFKWNTGGSTTNPCAENYAGPKAMSAPETGAMSRFLEQNANKTDAPVRVYIDHHAFSQLWMYPFGWTCDEPEGIDQVARAAEKGAKALKAVHGKSFAVGSICQTIYQASGSSVDSAFSFGIPYSYGIELRDQGAHGFILPRSEIVPSGEELEAGLLAMGKAAAGDLAAKS